MNTYSRRELLDAARDVTSAMVGRIVDDDEALVSSGTIDSMAILELITRLEDRLGVRLATSGLQPGDFDSVNLTATTLERALGR